MAGESFCASHINPDIKPFHSIFHFNPFFSRVVLNFQEFFLAFCLFMTFIGYFRIVFWQYEKLQEFFHDFRIFPTTSKNCFLEFSNFKNFFGKFSWYSLLHVREGHYQKLFGPYRFFSGIIKFLGFFFCIFYAFENFSQQLGRVNDFFF